ncbi:MAG: energy transducer TonB [Betaproteobacteria bacterium]|jgi:protein TonB|nr:energy transducer TonB [Betaproteobacteria bacterium]|tara:strand:- start:852 stop:1748 length:897 start_codon:yes stop_codon:yes gene_type:complete
MQFHLREANRVTIWPTKAMSICLVGSLVIHLLLMTLHFSQIQVESRKAATDLDVVLVNSHTIRQVNVVDALAQVNLQGGGNTAAKVIATSNTKANEIASIERSVNLAQRRVEGLERSVKELLIISQENEELQSSLRNVVSDQKKNTESDDAIDLPEKKSINDLRAKIDKDWMSYQERPRRKFIGANVKQAEFARYVERWRQRVADFGSRFYSREAVDLNFEGVMIVTVSIRSDGNVEQIVIDRSSGSDALDKAAVDIVRKSAPFDAFSSKLRSEFDVLTITRRWSFRRNDLDLIIEEN